MTNFDQGLWVIGYGSLIFKPPPHYSLKVSGHLQGFIRRFWQSSIDHRGTPKSPGRVVTLISLDELRQERFFHNDLHTYELMDNKGLGQKLEVDHFDISSLQPQDLKVCGCAYYIPPAHAEEVRNYLDIREQNGYELKTLRFYIRDEELPKLKPKVLDVNEVAGTDLITQSVEMSDFCLQHDEFGPYIQSQIYIGGLDLESFIGPESIHETAKIIKTNVGPSGKNVDYLTSLNTAVKQLGWKDSYLEDLVRLIE